MLLALEADVSALAPGGDGVAHVVIAGERRAVFVPRAVPGDRLRLEVDPSHRPARARILSIEAPGADRVAAACPWSVRCGGCDWMHVSAGGQARAHADHLRAALPAAWRDREMASYPAPETLAQRTRARVHVRCGRSGRAVVGMFEGGTHEPVEVTTCAVLDPALEEARRLLAPIFAGSRGRGDVQLALGRQRAAVLAVRWSGELLPETFARLEAAVASAAIAGVEVSIDGASRPARIGDPTPWMSAGDGVGLRLAPGAFGQASDAVNAALSRHVAELVRPWGIEKAVELYSGAGNLSVLLARVVGELVCIESHREACDAARQNLAARALSNARVTEADASAYVWAPATKLVVLDPPRTGARSVSERLAASRVSRVVYVACDTQTLGRDLAILESAYELSSVAAFEMFPQTSHVEAVVVLERKSRRAGSCP